MVRRWLSTVARLCSLSAVGAVALAGVGPSVGCSVGCRSVEVRPLALVCPADVDFGDQLHFDDEATFRTFLRQTCLPQATAAEIDEAAATVDFRSEAVFAAHGTRLIGERCLASRDVDDVQVCVDGLRVVFDDELQADAAAGCPGQWQVFFAMAREDLRAALDSASETLAE